MAWEENDDVPTSVNFLEPAHAREWTHDAPKKRPSRSRFFACCGNALAALGEPRVLELGSGPGHLARAIVEQSPTQRYVALDFSDAMHALARDHLGALASLITFVTRNFRDPAWQQSVTDQHIEQIVQYGGAAVGKSPAMPANPDLMSKPEVVAALRAHVRSLSH